MVSANNVDQGASFVITETTLCIPVVTLLTQNDAKLLQQLRLGFKIIINWNKYLSKPELLAQNQDLNHLVEPSFGEVNRLFVLAFENSAQRTSNILSSKYRNKKLQCYDSWKNLFWSTSKSNKMTLWKH